MFERTLQDLIRGLRAHKASSKAQEDAFLQEAMLEIREELKGKDMALKAEGVLKICYVSHVPLEQLVLIAKRLALDALPHTTTCRLCIPCRRGDELAKIPLEA
jgi:hypothetical protein